MRIRQAIPSDAPVIADFNSRLAWETEQLRLDPDTLRRGVEAILGDRTKGIYFVAEDPEAGVVGQLMITYEWSDWRNGDIWWLQSVFVREDFRRRGIFPALFRHTEQLARERGDVCCIRLYMDRGNERARKAYGNLGFEELNYEIREFNIFGEPIG
jgi:GNAT superfamily N-acetyltransferase